MTKSERKRLCAACREMFPGQKIPLFQKALRKQRKEKQEQERLTKKEETARIRAAVMERAGGVCECGRIHIYPYGRLELDHFFGRARARQSVENCWLLAPGCHRAKTENSPDREMWDSLFAKHCDRHGYPWMPRFGGRPKADAAQQPSEALSEAISSARESR